MGYGYGSPAETPFSMRRGSTAGPDGLDATVAFRWPSLFQSCFASPNAKHYLSPISLDNIGLVDRIHVILAHKYCDSVTVQRSSHHKLPAHSATPQSKMKLGLATLVYLFHLVNAHGGHESGGMKEGESVKDYAERHVSTTARRVTERCADHNMIDVHGAPYVCRLPWIPPLTILTHICSSDAFDLDSFFALHDLDSNGLLDTSEIEAMYVSTFR